MPPTLKVVMRFLWFVFSRVFIWGIAALLIVLSFYAAMDYMNAQILIKDGLQLRAEVIIKGDDPTALSKVFSKSFLEKDTLLSSGVYRSYAVTELDYSADVNFHLILPWQKAITLRVTEEVKGIEGTLLGSTAAESGLGETPPLWKNAIYNVRLIRYEGNWRIISMELVEELPAPTPAPTPEVSATPSPTVTPAPLQTEPIEPANEEEIIED